MSKRFRVLIVLLFGVLQFATQPNSIYVGDANAIRAEARYLIHSGRFGIDENEAGWLPAGLLPPNAEPDQYLWRNHGKYYSRWGLTNTLAYALPFFVISHTGEASTLLVLNCFNILLACLFMWGFLTLLAEVEPRPWRVLAYAALCCYGTFLNYYLRAQTSEIFQFVLLTYTLLYFRRLERSFCFSIARVGWRRYVDVLALAVLLALLVHAKIYYVVYAGVLLGALFAFRLRAQITQACVAVGVMVVAGLAQLYLNWLKFGSPSESGIGPGFPHKHSDWFSLDHIPASWTDYLGGPQGSIFQYFPVVLFALAAFGPLWRHRPREAALVWLQFVIILIVAGGFGNNRGEWSYGPRYLGPPLVLLAVAGIECLEPILSFLKVYWYRRIVATVVILTASFFMVRRQAVVSNYDFFLAHRLGSILQDDAAKGYFNATPRYEVISQWYGLCHNDGNSPLAQLVDKAQVMPQVSHFCQPNRLLF